MNKPMKVLLQPNINDEATIYSLSPLSFHIDNQDELLQMAASLQKRGDFNTESATSLASALKLLNDAVTERKHEAIFSDFRPFLTHFIDLLKHASEPDVRSHYG